MKIAITSQFSSLGTDKLTVQAAGTGFGPPGSTAITKLTTDNSDAIRMVRGVDLVVERFVRSVRIEIDGEQDYGTASNLLEETEMRNLIYEVLNLNIAVGRKLDKNDKFKVVIGSGFTDEKNPYKPVEIGEDIIIENQAFEVVGIFEKSGNPVFKSIIIMNDKVFRDLLNTGDEVDLIAVKIGDTDRMDQIKENIEKVMRKERGVKLGEEDFTIETPDQMLDSLNSILTVVQAVLVGIAAISLLVGGIGIMNTMYTSVLERTKEIGILKAIGARRRHILMLFLFESGILGAVGGMIGVLIGVGLGKIVEISARNAFGSNILQAHFSPTLIIGALMFSFVVGTVSGVLPAKKASQLHPVDALRQ